MGVSSRDQLHLPRGSKLLVDTNIILDFMAKRDPFAKSARLLMLLGKTREYQLWMSASQVTDLIYVLSDGGKRALVPEVATAVERLLSFVSVYSPTKEDALSSLHLQWPDAEDALLHQVAMRINAAAIITRNLKDFEQSLIPVIDADGFFRALESEGVAYGELSW